MSLSWESSEICRECSAPPTPSALPPPRCRPDEIRRDFSFRFATSRASLTLSLSLSLSLFFFELVEHFLFAFVRHAKFQPPVYLGRGTSLEPSHRKLTFVMINQTFFLFLARCCTNDNEFKWKIFLLLFVCFRYIPFAFSRWFGHVSQFLINKSSLS